jgi:hypothetical protein
MLELFTECGTAATWATVGCLFAHDRDELESYYPRLRPEYADRALYPYNEPVGENERADPLHFAPSLIKLIQATPRQEIASHTFSHYYCLEPGQSIEAFRDDIASAVRIAKAHGVTLRSIVFPRNQWNPAYADVLLDAGITCYRGNQRGWMHRADTTQAAGRVDQRVGRLLDTYIPISGRKGIPWNEVARGNGLCDVPASRFLRAYAPNTRRLQRLQLRRIAASIRTAAREQSIYHLWWHPHNFGANTDENLDFLRQVLHVFRECQAQYGMESRTMIEVAELARARS